MHFSGSRRTGTFACGGVIVITSIMSDIPKIKYFLYARKSSEDDRQLLSIPAQIDELKKLAANEELEIIEIIQEEKSAKAPGRELFNGMLARIHAGEAQGIVVWKLDRLARNPIDGGNIMWMMQNNVIKHIRTFDRSCFPTDNVLMMAFEFGMANQFIKELSAGTRRGMDKKARMGWLPGRATLGYYNNKYQDKGAKTILPDPEIFPIVRKLWDLLLYQRFSVQRIYEIGVGELGLRRRSGTKPTRSKIYDIFRNPFYYGDFLYKGVLYKGSHEPMITKQEFDMAQAILDGRSVPKPHSHNFFFTGTTRCGECGSMIVSDPKVRHQKNGNVHEYIYARCTKRNNHKCSQKHTTQKIFEQQTLDILSSIEIPQEFHDWAVSVLRESTAQEAASRDAVLSAHRKNYDACVRKLDALIDMRANNEISEDEFAAKRAAVTADKDRAMELLNEADSRVEHWMEYAEQALTFAQTAKARFEAGDDDTRRAILLTLGANLTLKDHKLSISLAKPLIVVQNAAKTIRAIHEVCGPQKTPLNASELVKTYEKNPVLGA